MDFQFNSTFDGKAIKIASMIDEHAGYRCLTLSSARSRAIGRSSSWAKRSPCGAGRHRCCGWKRPGVHFPCTATVLRQEGRHLLHSTRHALEQRAHRIIQPPTQEGMPEPQPLDQPARCPDGDQGRQRRPLPSVPALIAGLHDAAEYATQCTNRHHPVECGID